MKLLSYFLGFFALMAPKLVGLLHFGNPSIFLALSNQNLKNLAISLKLITRV